MEQGTGRPKPKMGNAHEPQQTQIFRPCDHDGPCETAAECSCFELKIPCEKTCGCNAQCLRRFPGCDCKREGRPCLHVDIATQRRTVCLCLQLNRECDPDTCGSCGVREVLDPVNRHCELPPPVCGNCAIQRRMRKHTLIGNSDVEGFGLFAVEEIKKDELIGEYTGELITIDEFDRRFQVTVHRNYSYGFELHRGVFHDSPDLLSLLTPLY
ncbi:SET domain-containing protein [Pseudovirgaria hyperparasitica]|uniref:SET domain-containing protein n=1 Tax=Pseudovirgaria hyperparasitica TaxID=470096 RepID=A0A6A6VXL8_9PEZI|nr:SET domain-containing protein [Pseudovirgaria hyperparasitica]KAF2754973.1 SET domain-containing protein [Pseudovirgaria hyperparasitica]